MITNVQNINNRDGRLEKLTFHRSLDHQGHKKTISHIQLNLKKALIQGTDPDFWSI